MWAKKVSIFFLPVDWKHTKVSMKFFTLQNYCFLIKVSKNTQYTSPSLGWGQNIIICYLLKGCWELVDILHIKKLPMKKCQRNIAMLIFLLHRVRPPNIG